MSLNEVETQPSTGVRTVSASLTVNGTLRQVKVAPEQLLVDVLRETLGLTGTKVGCETGQCGACGVLLNGVSVKSCAVLAVQADGSEVVTIEGLAKDGTLSKLQNAFWEYHAVQCGYCTAGVLMSITDLLQRHPRPGEADIRRWMDGTMCRCGVYQNVVRAVQRLTGQG
jgi:carbon-monoxide dehydrogenase small subunit